VAAPLCRVRRLARFQGRQCQQRASADSRAPSPARCSCSVRRAGEKLAACRYLWLDASAKRATEAASARLRARSSNCWRTLWMTRADAGAADLAALYLKGKIEAARFVAARPSRSSTASPRCAVNRPRCMLLTQALKGSGDDLRSRWQGLAWGQLNSDGYVGWLPDRALAAPATAPTHKVTRSGHSPFRVLDQTAAGRDAGDGDNPDGAARGRRFRGHARGLVSATAASRQYRQS